MSRKLKKKLMAASLALSLMGAGTAYANDMPTGGSLVTGTVDGLVANPASGATITATSNALINWATFDIGAGKIMNFNTGNGFVLMNQVTGSQMSNIYGTLKDLGNGHLILANPNGMIFHSGSVINANDLTLTTMQNLDATGFGKLTSGDWGPEINTNNAMVIFEGGKTNPATINMKHYLGVLAGGIMLDDYVKLNTQNSTVDLVATTKGQYSLWGGTGPFYSNGTTYTSTSNVVKIGQNTELNANGNSYNSISILGGQVDIGDYAQLDTGSDPDMSNVLIQAVATKNDSEGDPVYTATTDNVIHMGLVKFSNGNFSLVGGSLTGEVDSFKDNFTQVGDDGTPTPPGPTPPEPSSLTPEQKAQALEGANNLLDSAMNNDALKASQDAVSGSQKNSEIGDYVTVQSGGDSTGGLNITKGLEGLTVKEASARSRDLAKQYMDALNSGDKAKADQLKEALKEANRTVKVLKEQEKLTKEEKEKAEKVTQSP